MSDIETRILALLSEGKKHYTELKHVIVDTDGKYSNQTLSNHLKRLVKEGKITRDLRSDRSTIYDLVASYRNKGDSSSDIVTLEKLIGQLDNVFREEALSEVEPIKRSWLDEGFYEWLHERIYTKNIPKLKFAFYLDNATKERIDFFLKTGEVSSELKDTINSAFRKIRGNIPLTLENRDWELSLSNWNDSKEFAKDLTLSYGMRGVLFAAYDGKDYANKIGESLKNLKRLQKGHESEIKYLDEISRRCSVAYSVYKNPPPVEGWIYHDMHDLKDIYSYLDKAFWVYCWLADYFRRPALEVALISSGVSRLRSEEEIQIAEFKEPIPYDILDFDSYFKMKRSMLTEGDKKRVLKFTLLCASAVVKDRRRRRTRIRNVPLDEYLKNITELTSEVKDVEVEVGEKGIPKIPRLESDPILNFRFNDRGSIIDFSDEPMVISFMKYLNTTEKRQWLQKCLDLGLPLYTALPLKDLGFRVQWII